MSFKQTLSGHFFRQLRHESRIRISDICNAVGIKKTDLMDFEVV